MNQKTNNQTKVLLKSFFVLALIAVSLQAVAVWQAPSAAPTGGNVATPINSGADAQIKNGGLTVGFFQSNGVSVLSGSVDVGGTLTISSGTPGAGKLLTSNASGVASWSTFSSALGSTTINVTNGGTGLGSIGANSVLVTTAADTITPVALANGQSIRRNITTGAWEAYTPSTSSGAPTDATYITQTPNTNLSAEQALSSLGTGLLKNTTGTGILSVAVAGTDYLTQSTLNITGFITQGTNISITGSGTSANPYVINAAGGGGGSLTDGDKGDITVSNTGLTWNINASAVGNAEIANDAVNNPKILNGAVDNNKIAANAVTTDKIADGNVGTLDIANSAVTMVKIGATGTANNTTFLRGDGTWQLISSISSSGITSLNGLNASTQTFAIGTAGNSPAWSSATSTHTLNIPMASAGATVTAGLISNAQYNTFNNKENTLTFNAPLSRSVNAISLAQATSLANGYLSSSDWTTFNSKLSNITGLIVGGSNITITGSGTSVSPYTINASTGGSGVTDGDKGDITVSLGGTSWNIDASAVGNAEIANDAVNNPKILNGAVDNNKIAANAVTTDKIADGNVGTLDIANNAVTIAKLPAGATATTYLRGDGTWVTPAAGGSGTVTSVGLATGTAGTDISVSGSPITGSGTITLNIPTASSSASGKLSSADWTAFNAKLSNITGLVTAGSGINITGSGTIASPYSVSTTGGGGDMLLAGTQTVTGAKTFNNGRLILAGSISGTSVLNAAAAAGTTIFTLPSTSDTLVGLAATQTLTNKSISGNQITSAVSLANALSANGSNCTAGNYPLGIDAAGNVEGCTAVSGGTSDHGALTGLTDDDHTQYALLAGRSSGQSLNGGNATSGSLTLYGGANSSSGLILQTTSAASSTGQMTFRVGASGGVTAMNIRPNGDVSINSSTIPVAKVEIKPSASVDNLRLLSSSYDGSTNTTFVGFRSPLTGVATSYVWPSVAPTAGQVLQATAPVSSVSTLSWVTPSAGGSSALSSITAATATANILNGSNTITWNWDGITTGNGFSIASTANMSSTGALLNITSTGASSTGTALLVNNTGGSTGFRVNDSSSDTSPFIIDNNGDVSIGTTTTDAKLKVWTSAPGVVSTSASSTSVSGSGTTFLTTFKVGGFIRVGSETKLISNITSDTGLTVASAFSTTNTDVNYTVVDGDSQLAVYENGNLEISSGSVVYRGAKSNTANRFIHSFTMNTSSASTNDENLFIGRSSGTLLTNNTSRFSVGLGAYTLDAITSGQGNIAIGYSALGGVNSGGSNVGIGHYALSAFGSGVDLTTGSGNTALGYGAGVSSATASNRTAIGNGAISTADNMVRIGNSSVTVIQGQVLPTAGSDLRFKKDIRDSDLGLDFISKLRPVSYKLKIEGESDGVSYGFIAQELEAALDGKNTRIVQTENTKEGMKYVRYTDLIAPTIKAIQEQQKQIEELKAEIIRLKENQ